jgi:putative ABC transport system permease protein
MSILRQIAAVIRINLATLPRRWGAALVLIAGVAGVVGVLISVLALVQGFEHVFAAAGRTDRAIIVSQGAQSEGSSALPRDAATAVPDAPGIARDAEGRPILSMEMLTQLRAAGIHDGVIKNVLLRGIGPLAMTLRPELHLVQGRMFRPGLHEVIVGAPLQTPFRGFAVGDRLVIQNSRWTIVGSFASGNDNVHDSEILADAPSLMSAFHRTAYQSITVRLTSPAAVKSLATALGANAAVVVEVVREDEFFARQSRGFAQVLTVFGYFVGGIMAVGAVFAALNTMYAVVATQAIFIATLRAMGFNAVAVLSAIFLESLLLSVAGALAGMAISCLLFGGHTLNMLTGSQTQMVFSLRITPALAVLGIIWALVIGFIGGLFPAIRAARLPVATALRGS